MKYYFVCYETKGSVNAIGNVILKDIHPLFWASRQSPELAGIVTYLHFWIEIDENIAIDPQIQNHFPGEGD